MRLAVTLVAAFLLALAPARAATLENVSTPSGPLDVSCDGVVVEIPDEDGETSALMHAYAYTAGDASERPVTFLWNGGPGASAALLHCGFAAPMTTDLSDADGAGLAPNALTLIDQTDLVYVDPVGTGLSRATEDDDAYWGVEADAIAAALFVSGFLETNGGDERPVYLCGESYGALRVSAMLAPLRALGIEVEGVIFISPALDSGALRPREGTAQARAARADRLPSYAALAAARGERDVNDERAFIEDACAFAHGPYLDVLLADERPSREEVRDLKAQRARFTGKPSTRGRDRFDARRPASRDEIAGVQTEALRRALPELLNEVFEVETGERYVLMSYEANARWLNPSGSRGVARSDLHAADWIADHAADAPDPLRVFIAGGWYDLVTPFAIARRFHAEGAFGRCDVEVRDYPAGHVIYADPRAHRELARDIRTWFDERE